MHSFFETSGMTVKAAGMRLMPRGRSAPLDWRGVD